MPNEERHNKPDATDKKVGTQVQREHHKPDHGKDEIERAKERAQKPRPSGEAPRDRS